jgi:hypothetical protein
LDMAGVALRVAEDYRMLISLLGSRLLRQDFLDELPC